MAVDMFGFPIKTEEVTEEVTDTESIIDPKEVTPKVTEEVTPKVTEEVTEEKTQPVDMFGFAIKTPLAQPTETTEAVDMFGFPIKAEEKETNDEIGFWDRWKESLYQGVESFSDMGEGFKLAAQDLTDDEKGAAKTMQAIKAEEAAEALTNVPTLTAREIQKTFEESGLIPAGMKVPSFIVEQILKSGPQMIPPILAGMGATAVASPLGPLAPLVGAGVGVLTYGLQQFGNFMNTQGLEKDAPEELDTGSAAKWAAVTAPVGYLADRITLGLFKLPEKLVSKEIVKELAKRTAAKTAAGAVTKGSLKGSAIGIIAEAPTEYLETWAEFKQAGIDTDSPEAHEAYFEAFWSAAGLGGSLGGASRAYQGYNKFKKDNAENKQAETDKETQDDVDNTQLSKSEIANNIIADAKKERQRVEAREIKKTPIKTFDEPTFKKLGIPKTSTAYNTLKEVDLSTPEGLEIAENVLVETLNKETGLKSVNKQAVKNSIKQIQKSKEGLVNAESTTEGQGIGTSNTIPNKPKPPVTESIKKLDTRPVDTDQSGAGGASDTTGTVDNPLIDNAKNPILKKPKVGTKARIGRVVEDKVEVLKGVIEDGPNGLELVSKEGKGTIRTPLNNQQVLNPTKKDITQLETLAPSIKENKAKSKKQQLLESKKEENKKDIDTKEKELNEAGFESYEEFDQDGNSIKGVRKIREKKPSKRPGKFIGKKIIEGLKEAKTLGQVFNKLGTVFKERLTKPQASLLQKLRALPNIKKTKFNVTPGLEAVGDVAEYGTYTTITDSVAVSDNADAETVLHESTHAATALWVRQNVKKGKGVTALGRRMVNLYEQAKQASRDSGFAFDNELATMDEFITEAFNNQEFQKFLAETPSTESTPTTISSLWTDFVEVVTEALGLSNIENTLLNDVISLAPELFKGPNAEVQAQGPNTVLPKKSTNKSLKDRLDKTQEKTGVKKEDKQKEVEPTEERPVSWTMRLANSVFSFDAALNNSIKKAMEALNVDFETQAKVLSKISISQALHADELSRMFAKYGNIQFNPDTNKFEVIADPNTASYEKVIDQLKAIADKAGLSLADIKSYASQAFIARRLEGLKREQQQLIVNAKALVLQGKDKAARELLKKELKIIHMNDSQMNEALSFFNTKKFPELKGLDGVYNTWIEAKNNAIDVMVENEVLSKQEAEEFKQNVDYVPFYRDGMSGPKDFNRGLIDNKWHKFEGSYKPVADVFDNMDKWTRYSIRRSILNRAAINKVDATYKYMGPDQTDNPVAIREVPNAGGPNTVSINRIVNKETGRTAIVNYQFSDPTYAAAFGGLETIILPGIGFLSSIANLLRQNIVLYPLFSLAQLPQDAVSAMFSSGVKRPFMIPLRVLKEFPLTLINMSATHKDLKLKGAVGGFGSYLQGDTAAEADINKPGLYNAVRKGFRAVGGKQVGAVLNRIAMASDNAIRQAVYEQTMSETNDAQLALERAFEVINFRRAGSSPVVTGLRQVVPFFGAALQALSVQGRVLQAKGIAPVEKAQAAKQFVSTLIQVQMLTLAYNALMAGEDEFEKLDPKIRDRRILFGNGFHLTLRPDIFTFLGKIMPEQIIQNMYYESTDSAKMMEGIKRGLIDTVFIAPVPQALRPVTELFFDRNIRTGRSISPQSLENKDPSLQFTQSTSELAKLVGETTGLNPIKVDYFIRQYLGYTAGLGLMFVDKMIDDSDVFDYDRASKSDRDFVASIPGMSAFMSREYGNRHTADFYELKADVTAAVDEYNSLVKDSFSKKKIDEFGKENQALIRAKQLINKRTTLLSNLRKQRRKVMLSPRNVLSADEKKVRLDNINKRELQILGDLRMQRKIIYDSGLLD